jgi:D-methionine transport system ATP-binding protein
MDVVRQVCDRVAVLKAGQVVESGTAADVLLDPQHPETRALLADAGEVAVGLDFPGEVFRLTLQGDAVADPVISRTARATGTEISILDGRVGRLRDTPYAQLTLGLAGGDTAAARALLAAAGRVAA